MNWQPIETAPKDGTNIIAWNGKEVFNTFWTSSDNWFEVPYAYDTPTRWMPLPEPPTQELAND